MKHIIVTNLKFDYDWFLASVRFTREMFTLGIKDLSSIVWNIGMHNHSVDSHCAVKAYAQAMDVLNTIFGDNVPVKVVISDKKINVDTIKATESDCMVTHLPTNTTNVSEFPQLAMQQVLKLKDLSAPTYIEVFPSKVFYCGLTPSGYIHPIVEHHGLNKLQRNAGVFSVYCPDGTEETTSMLSMVNTALVGLHTDIEMLSIFDYRKLTQLTMTESYALADRIGQMGVDSLLNNDVVGFYGR